MLRAGLCVAAATFAMARAALGGEPGAPPNRCFASTQYQTWRAADAKTVYIRVNGDRFFRLDLARECQTLLWPDARLILRFRGGDMVCSALDIDLKVSTGGPGGIPEPCFTKSLTALTPAEAAALPKKFRP